MLLPACTGFGEAVLVTDRFGPDPPTIVVTVAVLFAGTVSWTDELTVAVPVITVPFVVPVATFTTKVNADGVFAAKFAFVQTIFPVPPTLGVRQLQPTGAAIDVKVVLLGTGSTSVALSAALGPLSVTRSCR